MLEISSTDRLCIAGLPRTGKTWFMRYLVTLAEPQIFIIDPLDQYSQFPQECRYIPRQESPMELEMIAKQLHSRSNVTLIVEEAEQYLSQSRPMLPYTSSLIRMGRNWGIGVYATTRRIQDINKRFFDLAQHVFFFRCGFKSREYIGDMLGVEYMYPMPNPKRNKTGYTITTLPPYHCLHFNLETETAQVITLKLEGRGGHPYLKELGKKSEVDATQIKRVAKAAQEEEVKPKEQKQVSNA